MGAFYSVYTQTFPPKAKFFAKDVPDQTGKVVIVTGGNAGIGKETCKALLEKNAKVYLAARNVEKAQAAIEDLKNETGREAIFLHLDLSSFESIRKAAEEFRGNETELHILFNNAGIFPLIDEVTVEGYDQQFGTNALGHYFLTILLLPVLISTAQHTPEGTVRVVTTSSMAHAIGISGIKWETLKDGPERRKFGALLLYGQSKLGNILFSNELAKRYGNKGIISISAHPGAVRSGLLKQQTGRFAGLVNGMLSPTSTGAITLLYAGTSPEAAKLNGAYLWPWARAGIPSKPAQDPKLAAQLWEWFEEQVKGY